MNDYLKYATIFGTGAGLGFLVAKKILEDSYDEPLEKENEVNTRPGNMLLHLHESEDANKEVTTRRHEQIVRDYGSIFSEAVEKDEEDIDYNEHLEDPSSYVIPQINFGDIEHYERISLFYYSKDGVLVDDDEEKIDNLTETFKLAIYTLENQPVPVVYVRDNDQQIDYEITRIDQSYRVQILGMDDADEDQ